MRRKLIVFVLAMTLLFTLTGCGNAAESISNFIKGDVTGEMNKTYATQWFEFTVKGIKVASQYDGTLPEEEGYKYVVVTVSETNTFSEAIPMGFTDFYLEAEGLLEEDQWGYHPFADTMMPYEFMLEEGETVEYDVVFSIPNEITEISFVYIEIDEEENIGATFRINHSL